MNVQIIAAGRIKEKFFRDALEEYVKRISRFASVTVTEIPDEKIPDKASDKEKDRILRAEGEKILSKIKPGSKVFAMCIEGKPYTSETLCEAMTAAMRESSRITFVIGSSLGLWDEVKRRADECVSFGGITLPHQLMRVVLAEQIYRAFKIMNNETYHK